METPLSASDILSLIPAPVTLETVSPSARHFCDVSSDLCYPGAKPRRCSQSLVTRLGVIPRMLCKLEFCLILPQTFKNISRYPDFVILYDRHLIQHSTPISERLSKAALLGVATDLMLLKESDFFIGTYSSNVSEMFPVGQTLVVATRQLAWAKWLTTSEPVREV